MSLDGTVMLITGAGRGIGATVARRAAAAGGRVVISGRDEGCLQAVASDIRSRGGNVHVVVQDLLQPGASQRIVGAAVERYGALHVLVNNAAIHSNASLFDLAENEWERVIATNLKVPFLCCQAAARVMRAAGGAIVNVASVVGVVGFPKRAAYGASKGGLIQLSRCLAAELAAHKIRVNAVASSVIRTPMTEPLLEDANYAAVVAQRTPLGRPGEPDDVANAILYLASPAAGYVTGHVLMVDGGWSAI